MKNFAVVIFLSVFLVGCSTITGMMNVKEHDPALALSYVDTKISMKEALCEDIITLEDVLYQAEWMHEYTLFVNDPQKVTAGNVVVDIEKAIKYSFDNVDVCNRFLKLANLKLKTLQKSWGTR